MSAISPCAGIIIPLQLSFEAQLSVDYSKHVSLTPSIYFPLQFHVRRCLPLLLTKFQLAHEPDRNAVLLSTH